MTFENCCAACNGSGPTGCGRTFYKIGWGNCDCSGGACVNYVDGMISCDSCCGNCAEAYAYCILETPVHDEPVTIACGRETRYGWYMSAGFWLGYPHGNPQTYSTAGVFNRFSYPSPSMYNMPLGNGHNPMSAIIGTMMASPTNFTNTSTMGATVGVGGQSCGIPCARRYGDPTVGQVCKNQDCGHPLFTSSLA